MTIHKEEECIYKNKCLFRNDVGKQLFKCKQCQQYFHHLCTGHDDMNHCGKCKLNENENEIENEND